MSTENNFYISTKLLTSLFPQHTLYQLRTNRTLLTRLLTTLLLSLNALSALSSSQGLPYYLFLCTLFTHVTYLLCLFTEKSTWTPGSLTLLSDIFGLVARLNSSETLLGTSLVAVSRMSLYSVQEYPVVMNCISGLVYSTFYFIWRSYITTNSYEYFTDTYNFPATAVHDFVKEHLGTLVVVFLSSIGASVSKNRAQEAHSKIKQEYKKMSGKCEADKNALTKLQNELKQVMQSQDLLVTYMSHEFRNHLNIILGNLDVLFGLARDQAQTEILKSCKICGDLLLSQINNLLDVAKINTGRIDITEFPTKMTNFLNEFWSTMKRCTIKKGLIGELAIDKTLPLWINIDSQRVQQILYNILDNAVKFTSKGSVKVVFCWTDNTSDDLEDQSVVLEEESVLLENTMSWKKSIKGCNSHNGSGTKAHRMKETVEHIDHSKQIVLNTHQADNVNLEQLLIPCENSQSLGYLKVYISDTGSGILEEDQKKIYDPFIKVDGTVTRSHAGSGLGLFIVKKLVEKMNGEVKLESEVNKGSCFKVILPLTTFSREGIISFRSSYHINSDLHLRDKRKMSTMVKLPTVGRLPVSSPKKFLTEVNWSNEPKRVLIVDDIEFNRSLMQTYFRSMQFEADFACNGLEALQMYQDNPERYFIVTLDIQMPVMDGVTACKSIRNYEKRMGKKRRVPIIIVTGNADDEEKRQILSQDEVMADYFFRKPFGLNECRICVQNILSAQTAETEM